MVKLREIIHCFLWAVWVDTGKPKWILPALRWINDLRVRRYEL